MQRTNHTRKFKKKCRLNDYHKEALIDDPTKCPFCGARIDTCIHRVKQRIGHINATAKCRGCRRTWREIYLLVDMKGNRK